MGLIRGIVLGHDADVARVQLATEVEHAQLTQAEMSWFEGAHLLQWQGRDALPEILMPSRDAFAWVEKFYGERLAPYAVLKLQEGA